MYEVTISVPNERNFLLDGICKDISTYISQIDGTQTAIRQTYRSYFSLACRDTFRFQMQRIVQKSVAKSLALQYKNIYVRHLLDLDDTSFHQDVLIDIMCAFDYKHDVDIIANLIDSNRDIFLDGYYNFRLGSLKRKWKNVVDMVLENPRILTDNTLILEFLQYLLQSTEQKCSQVAICLQDSNYILYDANGKVVQKDFANTTSSAEVQSIVQAICLNANKVKVYHNIEPSQDFCQIAKDLFDAQFVKVQ